jgi:hypothetical protein
MTEATIPRCGERSQAVGIRYMAGFTAGRGTPCALRTSGVLIHRNRSAVMRGPLRGLLAGAAAWRFGGGCLSTIIVFVLVFWLLGYC